MLLDVNSILILFALGLFAGVVNTLAGGGSLVTLPVLILFLGLDEATANGTNRLMVISAALVASYGYRSKGIATHPWGLYFGIAATFGAIIGARIAIDVRNTNVGNSSKAKAFKDSIERDRKSVV